MKKGILSVMIGLMVFALGSWHLYCEEKRVSRKRMRQACGYGIAGFGLAHILLGGMNALRRR
ncbi:hypothetical protein [Paludifilum halophilum]|uniref:Uncharacterized protein n=1 Tax=Paludifilum halophilum TaxID=1642702 RepID=A0A235B9F4_9BACL|nr:hypothetical protein [Paludifilum halophilum]OYD08940.1 hypothetical protein CHM34_03950 [Paludifilum halophilum]